MLVDLIDANNVVVGTQQADEGNGKFRIQLSPSTPLADGTYTFRARAHGLISNQGPVSPPVTVKLVTTPGDYNGNGTADSVLFRRLGSFDAQWFVQGVGVLNGRHFGAGALDVPIAADLYGTGQTDLLLYRPSTAQWFIESPSTGYAGKLYATFGTPGSSDIPVPADYFGSGRDVLALFRPATGQYFIGGQAPVMVVPGQAGDVPAPANYDGTGKAELAIFRPSTGQWFIHGPTSDVHRHLRLERRRARPGGLRRQQRREGRGGDVEAVHRPVLLPDPRRRHPGRHLRQGGHPRPRRLLRGTGLTEVRGLPAEHRPGPRGQPRPVHASTSSTRGSSATPATSRSSPRTSTGSSAASRPSRRPGRRSRPAA